MIVVSNLLLLIFCQCKRNLTLSIKGTDLLCLRKLNQGFHSQNFCAIFAKRNAKFSFFAHQFCAKKNNNLRNHSQKSFRALFHFCETQVLRNSATQFCAIPQFRKNQTELVTVCVSQNSILEKSCFGMSSIWSLLHN